MKKSLLVSEWFLLASFAVLFVSFVIVAKINAAKASAALEVAFEEKEVRVVVRGAVKEPVEVVLPAGSRICDLKDQIIFTEETNKAFFRRKKVLRDGEEIIVPKKTVE